MEEYQFCSLLGCTVSLQGASLSPLTQVMKFNCQSQDNHSPLPVSLDEFLPLAHSTPLKTSAKKLPPVSEVGSKRKNTLLMTLQKRKRMKRFDLIKAYAINYTSALYWLHVCLQSIDGSSIQFTAML